MLFSTRMNTTPHGSTNHVVRTRATSAMPSTRKRTPLASSCGPGGVEVLADQPHMRQAMVGEGRGAALIAAGDAEILDHLEDPIAVVVEADDGRLHGGIGHQLAHVVANRIAGHHVGRRQHPHAQHVAIKRHCRLAVRHAHAGMGQSGNHALNNVKSVVAALDLSTATRRSGRPRRRQLRLAPSSGDARPDVRCPRLHLDQIGVSGCGQLMRPAPGLCGAGSGERWCAI